MKKQSIFVEKKDISNESNEAIPSIITHTIKMNPLIQARKHKNDTSTSLNQIHPQLQNINKNSILSSFMAKNKLNFGGGKSEETEANEPEVEEQQAQSGFNDFFHMMRTKFKMRQVISKTESRRLKDLNENHTSIIHDKASSCFLNDENIKSYNIISRKRHKHLIKAQQQNKIFQILFNIRAFNPASNILLVWDLLQLIGFFVLGIMISIKITFEASVSDLIPNSIYQMIVGLFCLDIFVKLNTGFYKLGHYQKQRLLMTRYYLRKYLLRDLIVIFNLFIYYLISDDVDNSYTSPYNSILVIGIFFKFKQIVKISSKIEEQINNKLRSTHFTDLFNLLFTMLLVGHLFSCMWISMAKIIPKYIDPNLPTWFDSRKNMNKNSWKEEYLNAFYYSSVTMITVGYGDITPQNNYEILLCLFTLFIACCVFAYTVNSIGHIINEIQQKNTQNKQNINIIFNYMKLKNISQDMMYEVKQYLEYIWRETYSRNTEQEDKIIQTLNSNLRQRLMIEANRIVLQDSPIFRNNFSDQVLERTISIIKEKCYSPEEIIFRQNDTGDGNIYFIEKGKIQLYLDINYPGGEKKIQILQSLEKGQSFGHYSFFTGQPRMVNVRSQGFVTLLSIDRNSFIKLLQEYHEDYEQFCEIKEEVLYQYKYNQIGLSCYSCGKTDHLVNKCRLVHYQAPFEYIIAQQNFKQLKRQKRERFKKTTFHHLSDLVTINEQQFLFLKQNYELMALYTDVFLNFSNGSDIGSSENPSDEDSQSDENSESDEQQMNESQKTNEQLDLNSHSISLINKNENQQQQEEGNLKKLSFINDDMSNSIKEIDKIISFQDRKDHMATSDYRIEQTMQQKLNLLTKATMSSSCQYSTKEQSNKEQCLNQVSQTYIDNNDDTGNPQYQSVQAFVGRFNTNHQNQFIQAAPNQEKQISPDHSLKNYKSRHSIGRPSSQTQLQYDMIRKSRNPSLSTVVDFSNLVLEKQKEFKTNQIFQQEFMNSKKFQLFLGGMALLQSQKNNGQQNQPSQINNQYSSLLQSKKQNNDNQSQKQRLSILKSKVSQAMHKVINKKADLFSTIKFAVRQNRSPIQLPTFDKLKASQTLQLQQKSVEKINNGQIDPHNLQEAGGDFFNQVQNHLNLEPMEKQKNFRKYFPEWNLNYIVFKMNLPPKYLKDYKKNHRENAIKFMNNQASIFGQLKNVYHQDNQLSRFKLLKNTNEKEGQHNSSNDTNNSSIRKVKMPTNKNGQSQFKNNCDSNLINNDDRISEESSNNETIVEDVKNSKKFSISSRSKQNSMQQQRIIDLSPNLSKSEYRFIKQPSQIEDFLVQDQSTIPNPQLHTSFNEHIESEAHIGSSINRDSIQKKKFMYQF